MIRRPLIWVVWVDTTKLSKRRRSDRWVLVVALVSPFNWKLWPPRRNVFSEYGDGWKVACDCYALFGQRLPLQWFDKQAAERIAEKIPGGKVVAV